MDFALALEACYCKRDRSIRQVLSHAVLDRAQTTLWLHRLQARPLVSASL